jgi:hypothetical protein
MGLQCDTEDVNEVDKYQHMCELHFHHLSVPYCPFRVEGGGGYGGST